MSYLAKFKEKFQYPDVETANKALSIIDEEDTNPDDFERNALSRDDFKLDEEKFVLSIDFSGFLPASSWYGCQRLLCKMSADATKGKVKCGFEGDPDEWVRAGRGWN